MSALKIYCKDPNCEPVRKHDTDAGLDLRAAKEVTFFAPGQIKKVPTGLHVEIPVGYVGLIFPRSGLATKDGLTLANTIGVIDSDYRGEVICAMKWDSINSLEYTVEKYQRIAQLVIVPCYIDSMIFVSSLNNLSPTERGEGGFGHTGKH